MTPHCAYTVQHDDDELVIECPCTFESDDAAQAHGLAIARAYFARLEQEVA